MCTIVMWRMSWRRDAVWLQRCILARRSTSLILSGSQRCRLKVVRYRSSNFWMICTAFSTTPSHVTMSTRYVTYTFDKFNDIVVSRLVSWFAARDRYALLTAWYPISNIVFRILIENYAFMSETMQLWRQRFSVVFVLVHALPFWSFVGTHTHIHTDSTVIILMMILVHGPSTAYTYDVWGWPYSCFYLTRLN